MWASKGGIAALGSILVWCLSGCAARQHPRLLGDSLHAARDQFRVEYAFPDRRGIAGTSWSLDNFSELEPREGPDYDITVRIDDDGDGDYELDNVIDLYDVRLVRRETGTALWLRSAPVSTALSHRDLEFLALDYAEAVTGGSYYAAGFGETIRDRRYATEVTRRSECLWDGIPAYAIEFTVQNVDRAVIGVRAPDYLVTIVLAHAPAPWPARRGSFRSVLVAGLAGRPDDAARSSGAFRGLLSAVRIRGPESESRARGETTCGRFESAPPQ
jgi:hypothetical protein